MPMCFFKKDSAHKRYFKFWLFAGELSPFVVTLWIYP